MANSGVKATKECTTLFDELKKDKKHRYIVYKLNDKMTEIVPDKTGARDSTYDELKDYLEEVAAQNNCRYAVFDLDFKLKGSDKSKIVFIAWNPENAKTKPKMVYTSSKDYLKKALQLTVELQATDSEELAFSALEEKARAHTTH